MGDAEDAAAAAAAAKKAEHDARVEAIRKEGEARRKEPLEATKAERRQNPPK